VAKGRQPLTFSDRDIGDELAAWGKVALVETTGRISGKPISAAVGFVSEREGNLAIAAGSDSSDWALNLRAEPRCRVTIGDRVGTYAAAELADGAERSHVLTELILKYGTPAERLGRGPVFRLTPVHP
jgi:deazaflavin-dependent oxidoreductase (nitroreductase family)